MDQGLLFNDFFGSLPFLLFKLFSIILSFIHIGFSLVLLKQVKLMTKVIEAKISPVIYMVALVHLFFSIFVFIWIILFI